MSETIHSLRAFRRAKQVERSQVRWLWHCGYWDGPLSGVVMFEGAEAWVDLVDEVFVSRGTGDDAECFDIRRYAIVRLTPEELAMEKEEHALFQKYVGMHTTYGEDGKRPVGATHPREMWDGYYKQEHKKRDYTSHEVVAYFEE